MSNSEEKESGVRHSRKLVALTALVAASVTLVACGSSTGSGGGSSTQQPGTTTSGAAAGSGGQSNSNLPLGLQKSSSTAGQTINVLMVNNPQMLDLQKATNSQFTAVTGIKVNYTVLDENTMRNKASLDFKNQAGQYDVTTLSNFEVPIYAKNGWLANLSPFIAKDPGFKQNDILPAMRKSMTYNGSVYGEPFYGESSFLMYRKDIFQQKGLTISDHPTWDQVATLAAKLDGAEPGMKGICLRGQPGWGELGATLTTVVNTFGGTWVDKNWNAQLTSKPFEDATNFYVNLVRQHGEVGASSAGYTQCLSAMQQSKVAMWYDSTAAAGPLEAKNSPVAGKLGFVQAPVKDTKASGWLYTWAFLMEKASKHQDAAWQFISWAASSQYEDYIGKTEGWASVPAATRQSLYQNKDYMAQSSVFAKPTLEALEAADPTNPGTQPRPASGIQFIDIPEFTAFGDTVTSQISAAIAGSTTVTAALTNGQQVVQAAVNTYK